MAMKLQKNIWHRTNIIAIIFAKETSTRKYTDVPSWRREWTDNRINCTAHNKQPESHSNGRQFRQSKQHYGLNWIAARNRYSETLMLFFGIYIANAAHLLHDSKPPKRTAKKKTSVTQNYSISNLSFKIETDSLCLILQNSAILTAREIKICI